MLGIERRRMIVDKLRQERKVYVASLSSDFNVTQETIRRDLEKLENEGMLHRSYGGAVLVQPSNADLSFLNRHTVNLEQKQAIAAKTLGLVDDGCTIMADTSTTVLALVDLLKAKPNISIITNSIKLINDYADSGLTLISTGGEVRPHSMSLVGTVACRALASYNVDLAIIGCKGLDQDKGITESNEPEATVKRTMIQQAKNRLLLVDRGKFDQVDFVKTAEFADIDYVITDSEPGRRWIDFFKRNNIQLIY